MKKIKYETYSKLTEQEKEEYNYKFEEKVDYTISNAFLKFVSLFWILSLLVLNLTYSLLNILKEHLNENSIQILINVINYIPGCILASFGIVGIFYLVENIIKEDYTEERYDWLDERLEFKLQRKPTKKKK